LVSKIGFDSLTDSLQPFDTASLLSLSLPSIVRIRKHSQWKIYAKTLEKLVIDPGSFEERANSVVETYQGLLRILAETNEDGPRLPWITSRQSYLEISGVTLEVTHGRHPTFQQVGEIVGEPEPCQATVRMALVNKLSRHSENPNLTIDALRAYIADPSDYLNRITRTLRNAGFKELSQKPRPDERPGGMEQDQERSPSSAATSPRT
jgi:hypothetical protein